VEDLPKYPLMVSLSTCVQTPPIHLPVQHPIQPHRRRVRQHHRVIHPKLVEGAQVNNVMLMDTPQKKGRMYRVITEDVRAASSHSPDTSTNQEKYIAIQMKGEKYENRGGDRIFWPSRLVVK